MAAMTSRPSESDVDLGEPVEREGHETLLPSLLSSAVALIPVEQVDDTVRTEKVDDRPRGAKAGDIIGGRYIVEGQLGRGGMGRVMRVRHQALGKAFALKLIKSAIATNQRIREMFYREARLASALTHDNICS